MLPGIVRKADPEAHREVEVTKVRDLRKGIDRTADRIAQETGNFTFCAICRMIKVLKGAKGIAQFVQ